MMGQPTTNGVKEALNDFRIATCSPLYAVGVDATDEIMPMVYSLATLLEMGFRKDSDGNSPFDDVNPELIAGGLAGIARLTAFALFASDARN